MSDDKVKPLVFISVDGGPDESPKNQQTLASWTEHFKMHNLDAAFVFTHAAGSSAYNPVERRMAPLSKDTAGLILPFDTFGKHLDGSNKTIDETLEKKNFAAAGNILAEVWSETVIDSHPVVASYIIPPVNERAVLTFGQSEAWKAKHVRQSQYMLQIVKCTDEKCCAPFRTKYPQFFPDRFLPPPIPIAAFSKGLEINSDSGKFRSLFQGLYLQQALKLNICYDEHCPSLQKKNALGKTILQRRKCPKCHLYHSTIAAMSKHKKMCGTTDDMCDEDDSEDAFPALSADQFSTSDNIFDCLNRFFGQY